MPAPPFEGFSRLPGRSFPQPGHDRSFLDPTAEGAAMLHADQRSASSGADDIGVHDDGVETDPFIPAVRYGRSAACGASGSGAVGTAPCGEADRVTARVTYETVEMDGYVWLSRNRGGGWRTMIDAQTGFATEETCFIEDAAFSRMLLSGRASAMPIDVEVIAASHRWFTQATPVETGATKREAWRTSTAGIRA